MNSQLEPKTANFLEKHLNKQLLRYAAGSAILCPNCQTIMDCRRTVVATIHRTVDNNPEECVKSSTLCGSCWDRIRPSIQAVVDKLTIKHPELKPRLEIVDGRALGRF